MCKVFKSGVLVVLLHSSYRKLFLVYRDFMPNAVLIFKKCEADVDAECQMNFAILNSCGKNASKPRTRHRKRGAGLGFGAAIVEPTWQT